MLKQQARLFTKISICLDAITVVTALFIAHMAIESYSHRLQELNEYIWILLIVIPAWLLLLSKSGIYGSMRTKTLCQISGKILKVHIIGAIITTSCIFLINPSGFSRLLIIAFLITSLILMTIVRFIIKELLHYCRRKGYNTRNIIIIGSGEKLIYFAKLIKEHADWGLVISGFIPLCSPNKEEVIPGCVNLGSISDLKDICKNSTVDEVVFSISQRHIPLIENHISSLQEMGITVRTVLDFFDIPTTKREISIFHDELPMLTFYSKAFDSEQLFLKRCLDIIGSLIGLLITAILFPFIAIAIKMESKGSLFFGQNRVGENGRIFKCWKFRSISNEAEALKKELMSQNEMQGAMFKMKDDPRVTRIGKILRKTSLDELPQFWNVLRGEMSLVGTRPPTPEEVAMYENWHRKRICIKPGITGLWQVSGRNKVDNFDEVAKLDIRYIENWSIWLDIKLLIKTLLVVFSRTGAS